MPETPSDLEFLNDLQVYKDRAPNDAEDRFSNPQRNEHIFSYPPDIPKRPRRERGLQIFEPTPMSSLPPDLTRGLVG